MNKVLSRKRHFSHRFDRGFTMLEATIAVFLLALLLGTTTSGFSRLSLANRRNQLRGDAVAAGRQVIDSLRLVDVTTMPSGDTSDSQVVTVDGRDFDVTVTYCPMGTDLCGAETRRHIRVQVADPLEDNRVFYSTETVFTALD